MSQRIVTDIEYNNIVENYEKELAIRDKKIQKLQDINNSLRRTNRNVMRTDNTLSEMITTFTKQFKNIKLSLLDDKQVNLKENTERKYGILFLSDIHANTKVMPNEANNNIYNFEVLSKRLEMYINKSIEHFKLTGVTDVYFVLGGDCISSPRRNSEKLTQITSLTNASYLLSSMLCQAITRLHNNGFNITVTGIVGNESRIQEDFEMNYTSATENFDWMILLTINAIFSGTSVKVILPKNPITSIIQLDTNEEKPFTILINHGYNTKPTEDGAINVLKSVDNLIDKINLSIFGHFHHFVSYGKNVFNGCMIGNNAWSTNCGYSTAAEQTLFVIESSKQFYALPIFLQDGWQEYNGFDFDRNVAEESTLEKDFRYKGPEIILR